MGRLIASTQATLDGVVDPVGPWVRPDEDHGEYSFERQARSGGMVFGRKTYEGLAGYWPSQTGKWADMINPLPKPARSPPIGYGLLAQRSWAPLHSVHLPSGPPGREGSRNHS